MRAAAAVLIVVMLGCSGGDDDSGEAGRVAPPIAGQAGAGARECEPGSTSVADAPGDPCPQNTAVCPLNAIVTTCRPDGTWDTRGCKCVP